MATGRHLQKWPQATVMWLLLTATFSCAMQAQWLSWGADLNNRRFSDHSCINMQALSSGLKVKYQYTTQGSVVATPSVCGKYVYIVDWASWIYKLNLDLTLVWKVHAKNDVLKSEARVGIRSALILSPDCSALYTFTQWTNGPYVIALNTNDGSVIYTRKIDTQAYSRITQSGTFFNGSLYIGIASTAEFAVDKTIFRGSMMRLNAADGSKIWQRYMCPAGYAGCSVWGSAPAIDTRRNQVCVGTGNNYAVPPAVSQCITNAGSDDAKKMACIPSSVKNMADSMVCFNLDTGKVIWWRNVVGQPDIYLPPKNGLDFDFAQAPILIHKANQSQDVLIGTCKSGRPIAVSPKDGKVVWGPVQLVDQTGGYAQFGSCSNNKIYCAGLFWYGSPKGAIGCRDTLTGKNIWSAMLTAGVYGPLTCTQTVVWVPMFDSVGTLRAYDIAKGTLLGSFATGKTLFSAPAIVNGVAYVGSGYSANGGQPNNVIYALTVPLTGTC